MNTLHRLAAACTLAALAACGQTGALVLPSAPPAPAPVSEPAPAPAAAPQTAPAAIPGPESAPSPSPAP